MKLDIKSSTNQLVDAILDFAKQSYIPNKLESEKTHFKRLKKEYLKRVKDYQKQIAHGYKLIIQEMGRAPEMNLEKISDYEPSEETINLQELLEISDRDLELMFQVCYQMFENQRNQDCIDALSFLLIVNPHIMSFWIILGTALEEEGRSEEALIAYRSGILTSPLLIKPYVYAARCCLKEQKFDEALQIFDTALDVFKENKKECLEQIEEAESLRDYVLQLKEA